MIFRQSELNIFVGSANITKREKSSKHKPFLRRTMTEVAKLKINPFGLSIFS